MHHQWCVETAGMLVLKESSNVGTKKTRRVLVSGKAYRKISACVTRAGRSYETGGVLMGYKVLDTYYIVDVTTPALTKNRSMISFVLDGSEHTRKSAKIISKYLIKPQVLGIWHSHICDIDRFSEQDRRSNTILARSLGEALSMIVTLQPDKHKVKMTTFLVTRDGRHYPCENY